MLFRPEEVHSTSCIGSIFKPLPERHGHIPDQTFGFGVQDYPVADLYPNWKPTIETGCIDTNRFARKEPADRQRFEPSLAEPLLLALDGNAVLGGEVVERGERGNVVRIRE